VRHIIQRNYKESDIFVSDAKHKVIKKKGQKKDLLVELLGVKPGVLFESKV